jgi:hypothetical protein
MYKRHGGVFQVLSSLRPLAQNVRVAVGQIATSLASKLHGTYSSQRMINIISTSMMKSNAIHAKGLKTL